MTNGPPPSAIHSHWWFRVASSASLVGIFVALSPWIPLQPMAGFSVAFLLTGMTALWVGAVSPPRGWAGRGAAIGAVVCLVAQAAGLWPQAVSAPLVCGCLLTVTTYVGGLLGARVQHPGHLLFVVWVSSLADVVSVHHQAGVTHAIADSEVALSVLALPFALLGTGDVVPILGGGDVVFIAIYFAVARRHDLAVGRLAVGLAGGLVLALAGLLVVQRVIPALPLLGLGVLASLPEACRPPQQQRAAAVAFSIGLTLFVAVALYLNAG